jgi:hypothetical protein
MPFFSRLPILLALLGLLVGGAWLLLHSEAQARDTIRKHHLEDIEQALYFAYRQHGTYPPYNEPAWCGSLDASAASAATRQEIEAALREQHKKYANPDKPFPIDPLADHSYFYWKRSPAVFELYSILEADPNQNRSTHDCNAVAAEFFDYGLNSRLRTSTFSL